MQGEKIPVKSKYHLDGLADHLDLNPRPSFDWVMNEVKGGKSNLHWRPTQTGTCILVCIQMMYVPRLM